MSRMSFKAMGTTVVADPVSAAAEEDIRNLFASYEKRFTRFDQGSELSRLNRGDTQSLSAEMCDLLARAEELRDRTAGLLDIGVGSAVLDWGYDRTFGEVVDQPSTPARTADSNWSYNNGRLKLDVGTKLDLGGLVKGWAADRIVESGLATMLSAGGDVRSSDPAITSELLGPDEDAVALVAVGVGGIATSSTLKRRWMMGRTQAHHLIDPRFMTPRRSPIHSASVVAESAIEAEAGAKAVLLLGAEGLSWASEQTWIRQAIAQWHDGTVYSTPIKEAS
jgi:thiamine biosynthesis lipoprotein